jgi:hypothetical protein
MESLNILKQMMIPFHREKLQNKSWGFEYWFVNNSKYCGKIIQVRGGKWSSYGAFHYHKVKDETFLVLSGTLLIDVLSLSNTSRESIGLKNILQFKNEEYIESRIVHRYMLSPYQYLRIRPGVLHRFSALNQEALFTETSTTHKEEDSYRIVHPSAEYQLSCFEIKHVRDSDNNYIVPQEFSYLFTPKKLKTSSSDSIPRDISTVNRDDIEEPQFEVK